jgi:hypothetical protein
MRAGKHGGFAVVRQFEISEVGWRKNRWFGGDPFFETRAMA